METPVLRGAYVGEDAEVFEEWLGLPALQRKARAPQCKRKLSKRVSELRTSRIFDQLSKESRAERKTELVPNDSGYSSGSNVRQLFVTAASRTMKILERTIGNEPTDGHSLWISLHGGGSCPPEVNDSQWINQIHLYTPNEGIYVAPRAPTDTWNQWHQSHIDDLLQRLIENYIIHRRVNPDRVYLMGYSSGGDGVYQLAPRMADRFAAASMMAGHPNGVSLLGVRNLPFMIWAGENDHAYKRNTVAAEYGGKLDELEIQDTYGGYKHQTNILKGKGHWMDREDAACIEWMEIRNRDPWPKKVVWHQTGRTHNRFYWLSLPTGLAKKGQLVIGTVSDQTVDLSFDVASIKCVRLRLSDQLLDLDKEITIRREGSVIFCGIMDRTIYAILTSLEERLDPKSVATVICEVHADHVSNISSP